MRKILSLVLSVALLSVAACSPSGDPPSVPPALGAVLSRVDVPRLLDCSKRLPDYVGAAKCLGAEAATQGLKLALDKAVELADRAVLASGPAGADDMTDAERSDLGVKLDGALDVLAAEIDATHGAAPAE